MVLYVDIAGAFSIIVDFKEEADRVMSQVNILIRALYPNSPISGARMVIEIFDDSQPN